MSGGMLGSAGGAVMGFGGRVFSSVIGLVIGVVVVVVGLGALAFFVPMMIQGQKAGIDTGVAVHANVNVAVGAAVEAIKDGKSQRAFGAQLERESSQRQLAKMGMTGGND